MKPAFNAARLVLALARGAVEWLYNPRTRRHILRSRAGQSYNVRPTVTGSIQLTAMRATEAVDFDPDAHEQELCEIGVEKGLR